MPYAQVLIMHIKGFTIFVVVVFLCFQIRFDLCFFFLLPSLSDSDPVSASAEKLHPSWEASRKRKAEQSGLKAFEGTKIIFNDD